MAKRLFSIPLLMLGIFLILPLPSWSATVQVEVIHSQDMYHAGKSYPLLLRLSISKPWYIHGPREETGLIATQVSFSIDDEIKIEGIRFPPTQLEKFDYSPTPLELYHGTIMVGATLVIREDVGPGKKVVHGKLFYQACSEKTCMPPEEVPMSISLTTVPSETAVSVLNQDVFNSQSSQWDLQKEGLWLALLAIFLGGLALNLTPCVYPLIPITLSYFGGRSDKLGGMRAMHSILYLLGLSFTNSILGLSAALSGEMLGSLLQNPFVLAVVACVLLALALSLFGVWEFRLPSGITRVAARNYKGYFGTLFMGLTLGIVAAPCLGPFLLGLLTYVGQQGDPFLGFLYFFVLSLGLGLPLSLLSLFAGAAERLPLSGEWMVWVRKLLGWVLIGMAAYILSPLFPQPWLLTGLAIPAGIHLGWIDRTGKNLKGFSYFKKGLGLVLAAGGLATFLNPVELREGISWQPYDPVLLSRAIEEKKPLILDFYAEWCGPCKAMERTVFHDPEVLRLSRGFITLRLDLTNHQPFQDEVLRQYHVRGVPTVLFFDRDGREMRALRVESYTNAAELIKRMEMLLK